MGTLAGVAGALFILIIFTVMVDRTKETIADEYNCASGYEGEDGNCCLVGYTLNASDSTRCLNDTWPTSSNVSTAVGTPTGVLNETFDNVLGGAEDASDMGGLLMLMVILGAVFSVALGAFVLNR